MHGEDNIKFCVHLLVLVTIQNTLVFTLDVPPALNPQIIPWISRPLAQTIGTDPTPIRQYKFLTNCSCVYYSLFFIWLSQAEEKENEAAL